ncbi:diguanylate cyclase [Noviherbaspirillum sp. ST9]|uniref:GGDEF domain-containing protein n=1 Tax=Noviherbaspirillum sp. ST9 TaxID=3401606 RepID=UPI003B589368
MSSTFNILIVGALFCVLMLLVLISLLRSGIPGIREWCLANAFGCVALVLYAFGRELMPLIAYEVANGVYAAASAAMLAGFRRYYGKSAMPVVLGAGVLLVVAAIALFHYSVDSYPMRTVVIAVFQGTTCLAIATTIVFGRSDWRSHYPSLFTVAMAAVITVGHGIRSAIYLLNTGEVSSLLQPSPLNLLFVSAGTFILPVLTFGAVMLVHDTMLARAELVANRDFLTGAWTRRAFFEHADRELLRTRRMGRQLSLLLLDVDHFKKINDTYGHAVGDLVLIDLVKRAATVVRAVDFFARVGGEEFAVLLPETSRDAAAGVAERMRAIVAQSATEKGRAKPAVPAYTISIGVSSVRGFESLQDLMRRADAALYAAKAMGRNRAVSEVEAEV